MRKLLLAVLYLSVSLLYAQNKEVKLSGNLHIDSRIAFNETKDLMEDDNNIMLENKKSLFLAGLFSAVLPGAGEFYTENYLKSAIFVAVEAAAIYFAVTNDKKGDDKTSEFEAYAQANWDVKRYAAWTLANAKEINGELTDVSGYHVFDNNGNVVWSELNRLESDIGNYYSHRLAPFGEQQYYEMIGKYSQFNVGWSEFGDDPNKPFNYGDPLTSQFLFYSGQRGEANDFYTNASTAVKIIVANHVISIIDAIWSAHSFNKNLSMKLTAKKINLGYRNEVYPELSFRYGF